MANTFNGIGTTFYGKRAFEPFFARTSSFEVVEELPTNLMQVLSVYVYSIFIVGWTVYLVGRDMSGIGRFLLIAAAVVLPHALRFLVRKLQG